MGLSDFNASRRQVLGAAAGLLASALVANSTDAQEATGSPAASPAADGSWTFTDDLGVTVTLPQRPTKIVADVNAAAPLWDFGIRPIAVSGWTVTSDSSWGNVDRSTPAINAVDGQPEPDLEAILDLGAELFVTIAWSDTDIWSFQSPEAYQKTQAVVPVVCISVANLAIDNLQRFVDLAVSLGADLASPELVQAKTAFDEAVSAFSAVAAEKADLTSFFAAVRSSGDEWYAAYAPDWADLGWYRSLGMNIVDPGAEPGSFWETLSLEEALKYPCDVFFNSTRLGSATPAELQANPVFGQHPAIKAGQIGAWNQDFILSYQGLKAALDTMSATLSNAQKVTS